jgi:cyclopropane fatty-acyl-phospholipid synthase-like methyltransferase
MGNWEEVFKNKGKFFHKPHKDMKKLVKLFKDNKVKTVLDLGCGSGRHTIFLAKNGFEVYGTDNSESGLKYVKTDLKKLGLKAKLKNADCFKKFPYKDNFFDAIISVQVIHHAKIEQIKYCISEIERTLKPNGLIFIIVTRSKKNKYRSKVKMIAPRTFIPLEGHEIGVPHYLYNKELFRKSFNNFKVIELYKDGLTHYCLLGRLKEK